MERVVASTLRPQRVCRCMVQWRKAHPLPIFGGGRFGVGESLAHFVGPWIFVLGGPLRGAGFCVIGWCSFAAGACCKVAAGVGSSGVGSWLFCGSLCCRCRPFFFRRGRLEGAPPWGVVGPRARGNWCAFAKKKKVASLEKWNSRKTTLVCNFYSFARGQYQELL